jgi:hypothetical protein
LADEIPCPLDRHVVLAEVYAIGARSRGQVGSIVYQQQGIRAGAESSETGPGGKDGVVACALHSQLHDVHPSAQRGGEEVIGALLAHEEEPRRREALTHGVHGGSLPGGRR